MQKVILLDRDGVINYDSPNYIKSTDEFNFIPGSVKAIAQLTKLGFIIGIATNQSGIARGLYDHNTLNAIHTKMLTKIRNHGGDIAAIEYCPHHPKDNCVCRKPAPGMLYKLADRLECELTHTPFIGDKLSDLKAALNAGAKPILIANNNIKLNKSEYPNVPIYHSLALYAESIITNN